MKKLIKKINPDIINAHHTDEFALAAIFSNYPYVITVHGIYHKLVPQNRFISRWKFISKVELFILRKAKYLIASSPFAHQAINKLTNADIFNISNVLDISIFTQEKDYNHNHELIYIGSIIKDKGIDFLFEAILLLKTEFPYIILRIIGTQSPYERSFYEYLLEFIAKNNLSNNIIFEGFVPEKRKIEKLRNSTILVHPSKLETFCMSIAEAMATSTPIVATNVGGIPYTVGGDENALLVNYGSSIELAEKIRFLFNNVDHRIRLGKNGYTQAISRFTPSIIIPQHLTCFQDIINNWNK